MKNNYKICAVVVTYNRKELLINCLDAINKQTYKPHTVLIVDNASTDGTKQLVAEKGFYNNVENGIIYRYLLLPNNQGGAGGFYNGMKTAYEADEIFDAVWVMDDDGRPDENCLYELLKYLNQSSFISPLVHDIENHSEMAFATLGETNIHIIKALYPSGIVKNHANPFNGILFKRDLMEKIGFPKKEMFIWGDEHEYQSRAVYYGFSPIIVLSANHYHPKDKLQYYKDIFGRKSIIFVPSKLRCYCKYRNTAYVIWKYGDSFHFFLYLLTYMFFFLFQRRFDCKNFMFFMKSAKDGVMGNFGRHQYYL